MLCSLEAAHLRWRELRSLLCFALCISVLMIFSSLHSKKRESEGPKDRRTEGPKDRRTEGAKPEGRGRPPLQRNKRFLLMSSSLCGGVLLLPTKREAPVAAGGGGRGGWKLFILFMLFKLSSFAASSRSKI